MPQKKRVWRHNNCLTQTDVTVAARKSEVIGNDLNELYKNYS